MNRMKVIKNYCEYQEKHCQDQIRLLTRIEKNKFYKFIHGDARDMRNIYTGRLQAVNKILQIMEEK